MSKKFKTVSNYRGYVTKPDETNTSIRNLVDGSQNVLINDAEKVTVRKGYTLFGASNSASNACKTGFTWNSSTGLELPVRSYDDELEVYLGTVDGVALNAWTRIKDSWSAVAFDWATWWDTDEQIDILLLVNGDSNNYSWSGGVATIASATSNTITKNGSTTWAQNRFNTGGTTVSYDQQVIINGTTYTYTGGEGTTTLTGVTPDPSSEAADSVAVQTITTHSNKPAANLSNDMIKVLNNQAWIGSTTTREVYVSKNTDFTDVTFSSPRLTGEGALLTLDGVCSGFAPLDEDMVIFTGKDGAFKSYFENLDVGGAIKETIKVKKLATGAGQAAQSQDLIANIGKSVVYVTNEPALRIASRAEDINTVNIDNISDPIKPDFDGATFTNGQVFFNKNRIYITRPSDGKVMIYDVQKKYWQPPQILPIQRFSDISGSLTGHSNTNPESYTMFSGYNDNDAPIDYRAKFAYVNYGNRENLKQFDEFFSELYMSPNTDLNLALDYDYKGATGQSEFTLEGNDETYVFGDSNDTSLGKKGLGQEGLGSSTVSLDQLRKYRIINTMTVKDFYELQVTYSTTDLNANFEILSHGSNARLSTNDNFIIKK